MLMLATALLEKLLEIESSLGRVNPLTLRAMLMEAQTQVLQIEQEAISMLLEIRRLREQREPVVLVSAGPRATDTAERPAIVVGRKTAFAR